MIPRLGRRLRRARIAALVGLGWAAAMAAPFRIGWGGGAAAQDLPAASSPDAAEGEVEEERSVRGILLPGVFTSRETGVGFGAFGYLSFRIGERAPEGARPMPRSTIGLQGVYTLRNQTVVALPAALSIPGRRVQLVFRPEFRLFPYRFYVLGNDSLERYQRYTERSVRWEGSVRVRLVEDLHLALVHAIDTTRVTKVGGIFGEESPSGFVPVLSDSRVVGPGGSDSHGFGVALAWDTRDSPLSASKGWLHRVEWVGFGEFLGSDFGHTRATIDLRHYVQPGIDHILAFQVYMELRSGDVPFHRLAALGGTQRMRGFFEGRYRDHHYALAQVEYRFPIVWRFHGAVFGSPGLVFGPYSDSFEEGITVSGGAGLRFRIVERTRLFLRFDAAFGPDTRAFILQMNEAF